ncbi:MAG: carboxypeptidase-like regulatory domain-containing protein [Bradymonadaceae bacterium]
MFGIKVRLLVLGLIVSLTMALACSDDTRRGSGGSGGGDDCGEGLKFNPILGECEVDQGGGGGADNGTPDNNVDNNTNGSDAGVDADDNGSNNPNGPDTNNPPPVVDPGECGPGNLIGRACAPSGAVLAAAEVIVEGIDCDGAPFTRTTTTNGEGEFQLDGVPSGEQELTIRSGSFESDRVVVIRNGQTTDLTGEAEKVCLEGGSAKIAVIKGAYDHIQGVLDDLGLEYDIRGGDGGGGAIASPQSDINNSVSFLQSAQAMSEYDIVFINCGTLWQRSIPEASRDLIIESLRTFVQSGKSLYVSDHAHPFVQRAFPEMLDFYGNDAEHVEARQGYAPQSITARVGSVGMQTLLGRETAEIQFPHDPSNDIYNNNWVVAQGANANTTVHLDGTAVLCGNSTCTSQGSSVSEAPLLVSFDASPGRVIFTSFHNKAQADYNDDMIAIMRYLIFQL